MAGLLACAAGRLCDSPIVSLCGWSAYVGALVGAIAMAAINSFYYHKGRCRDPEMVFAICWISIGLAGLLSLAVAVALEPYKKVIPALPAVLPGLAVFVGIIWSTQPATASPTIRPPLS